MGLDSREHYILSEERILDIVGQAVVSTNDKLDILPEHLVAELFVLVSLLGAQQPVSHFRVNGHEEEKKDNNVFVRHFFGVE
jgi:hypothetical protein